MTTQMHRALAAFEVRSLDAERRTFRGWATTPSTDRMGDTINPLGAVFKNPLPLLHSHRHDMPIGTAWFEPPTRKGVAFEAEIPRVDEPGPLKDRVDTAWGEIKHGLVRAVSVGFRAIKYAFLDDGGIDFQEVEIYELSIVTVPANAEAVIERAFHAGGPLPADVVRLVAQASQPGIPLVRTTRPRFYIPG